jgi:hypothetical protein
MTIPSEAQARITINKMLEEAGWRFLPDADRPQTSGHHWTHDSSNAGNWNLTAQRAT